LRSDGLEQYVAMTERRYVVTVHRCLLTAAVLAAIATGGAAGAGCGGDEGGTREEGQATAPPTADPSSADPAVDPTGSTLDATSQPRDAKLTIALKGIAFKPQYLTARMGQTLVFRNEDDVPHRIKGFEGQNFTSKTLKKGDTYAYRIKQDPDRAPLAFLCTIHPEKMRGGVVVAKD
jgi:plastocyanin